MRATNNRGGQIRRILSSLRPIRVKGRGGRDGGRRGWQDERGSALLEFALVTPMLMAILTGAASFSMGLYSYQQLGYATANAAQLVGAEQGLTTDPCAAAVTSVTGSLTGWKAANLTYTVTITDATGAAHTYGPTKGSSFSCAAGATLMAQNQPLTITVSYQYTWLPVLNFSPSSNLVSSQTVLTE